MQGLVERSLNAANDTYPGARAQLDIRAATGIRKALLHICAKDIPIYNPTLASHSRI